MEKNSYVLGETDTKEGGGGGLKPDKTHRFEGQYEGYDAHGHPPDRLRTRRTKKSHINVQSRWPAMIPWRRPLLKYSPLCRSLHYLSASGDLLLRNAI